LESVACFVEFDAGRAEWAFLQIKAGAVPVNLIIKVGIWCKISRNEDFVWYGWAVILPIIL
jgi:hypothetical protein